MAIDMLFFVIYLALCLQLCWQDIRYRLLPDRFTCPLLWCGLLWHLCCRQPLLPSAVWGAIAGYVGFAAIYWGYYLLRRNEGLGYGDVKYLAALGAWHGWQSLPGLVLIATLLACLLVLLRVCSKEGKSTVLKNPLPFGPFLATAGVITFWQPFGEVPFTLL